MSKMDMRVTITTKGVKGQPAFQNEFFRNLPQVLGARPLDEYAANVASTMQEDAPVRTGYLRNNIRHFRVSPTEVAVMSWAPYSGPVDRHHPTKRGYFSDNTTQSATIASHMIGDASMNYLRILINKYQNGP